MKELVEMIVKSLVDSPEDVVIEEKEDEYSVLLEVSVNKEDMGKVIGKQGKIAKAMRTLLKAVSSKTGKRYKLEIMEWLFEYFKKIFKIKSDNLWKIFKVIINFHEHVKIIYVSK